MGLIPTLIVFGFAVALLIASAKFFTSSAESIGTSLGMPPFVIGIVIVSIGTSLPELVAGCVAAISERTEIVPANIIGASLSNLLFVLGIAALSAPRRIDLGTQYIYIDLNYLAGTAWIVIIMMMDGIVRPLEACWGLFAYCIYLFYLIRAAPQHPRDFPSRGTKESSTFTVPLFVLLVSGLTIYFAATLTIESLSNIAMRLGVSQAIVSLTLLSLGTTLPEAVVSLTAARQGKGDLAIGNVLGSCIFNGLAISGIASLFSPLVVTNELIYFSLPVYGATVLIFYLLAQDKKISQFEGALLLLMYCLFMGKVANLF